MDEVPGGEDPVYGQSIQSAVKCIAARFKDFEEDIPNALKISFSPASIILSLKIWT